MARTLAGETPTLHGGTLVRADGETLSWWRRGLRAVGELSVLRSASPVTLWSASGSGSFLTPYSLDSKRVTYALARELYGNTAEGYKLGAGFAKPIINTAAGFMGVPAFAHPLDDAQQALTDFTERASGVLLRINRNAQRDGDVFARLVHEPQRFAPTAKTLRLQLIPPEWVTPVLDPLLGVWRELVIRYPMKAQESATSVPAEYTLVETLTSTHCTVRADGRAPASFVPVDEANPWGFIPVVHFKNEGEEDRLFGQSDLEPVEPFFKAYHDVMLSACQGSKLFSKPKVKFTIKDVATFLKNNFPGATAGGAPINFQGKDLYFFQDGENAKFITADSGIAGITTLLEFLYYCIVDVSETPEFAFGTAVASSKASVSEQMVPLVKKIERKRGQFAEPYNELAAMFLAMWGKTENLQVDTAAVRITWPDVTQRDEGATADTITTLITGFTTAIEKGLLSMEAAAEYLRRHLDTMLPWDEPGEKVDEKRRIEEERKEREARAAAAGLAPNGAPPTVDDEDEDEGEEDERPVA